MGADNLPFIDGNIRRINSAPDLLVHLRGEKGQRTRAAVGVASPSQNSSVEMEVRGRSRRSIELSALILVIPLI
jgi:hypothetical protein